MRKFKPMKLAKVIARLRKRYPDDADVKFVCDVDERVAELARRCKIIVELAPHLAESMKRAVASDQERIALYKRMLS